MDQLSAWLSGALLFAGTGLWADDAVETRSERTDSETRFEAQILVTGGSETLETLPGSADFIELSTLEQQSYDDVNRILRQVPGINIQEEEGFGLRPNIGMRGTGVERSSKITLMEDGVLIAPAPYASPAAYYFPTSARMEAVEVRKGSAAIGEGPYTTGGVINLVSSAIPPRLGASVELSYGSENTVRLSAKTGGSTQRLGWLVETFQLHTDGFKDLDGGGRTGVRLEDYLGKIRFNSATGARLYQLVELKLGRTDQFGEETYLGLTQEDFDRTPVRRYAGSQQDWIETEHEQIQIRHFIQPTNHAYLTTTVYRNDFFRNWHKLQSVRDAGISSVLADPDDYPAELAVLRGEADDATGSLRIRNNRRTYRSEGVDLLVDWQLPLARIEQRLRFGVRAHRDYEDRFQEEDRWSMVGGRMRLGELGRPGSQANRIDEAQALALFVTDLISVGRWAISPGVRVESIDFLRTNFGKNDPVRSGDVLVRDANAVSEVLPGVGVNFAAGARWSVFGGLHRGFAPPGPGQDPNTESEKSWNYELGFRVGRQDGRAKVVAFYSDYSNLLGRDTLSSGGEGTGDAFNGGAVEVVGVEAAANLDLGAVQGWSWSVPLAIAYTYTRGEFRSSFVTGFPDWAPEVESGDRLPYLPEHQLSASAGVSAPRWDAFVNLAFVDEMRSSPGQRPIRPGEGTDPSWVLDVSLAWRLTSNLSVRAQAMNLLDEVYVAARRPAGARPGRPRAVLLGLDWEF